MEGKLVREHHRAGARPFLRALAVVLALAVAAGCGKRAKPRPPIPEPKGAVQGEDSPPHAERPLLTGDFADDFNADKLDGRKWLLTRQNDFAEFAVDVVPVKEKPGEGRLRLRAGTIGTDDKTVKFLGVASRAPLSLSGRKRLALDFDWNRQRNGSYLTGAIYLCPTLSGQNPADAAEWLRVGYVGVPPGKNARLAIWLKSEGRSRWLYDEGWPKKQRTGRLIGKLRVEILFDRGEWKVLEDGKVLFESKEKWKLPFDKAHLYLQMSSHSNYPPREIFFDHVQFGLPNRVPSAHRGPPAR